MRKKRANRQAQERINSAMQRKERVQAFADRENSATADYEAAVGRLKEAVDSEAEFASKVQQYTDDLSKRQYTTPSLPLRCNEERNACLECYRASERDGKAPLHCTEKVDAFMTCAAAVQKEFVKRECP